MHKFIKELLNGEKVEWRKLGEVCELKRGKTITAKTAISGDVPVISGGLKPAYYHNEPNRIGETITIAGSGAYAGFVSFWDIPIYVADAFSVIPKENKLLIKYVYYFLTNNQNNIYKMKQGAGIPHVYPKDVSQLIIPIPSLKVQKEIVDILDKFCQLKTALKTERELRLKQYGYYRDKLLTFGDEVEWRELKEVCYLKNGYTPSKKNESYWTNGTIPWFRMEDIRENGRVLNNSLQKVNQLGVKGKLFEANSIIISTSATIGEHALITIPFLSNQRFTCLTLKEEYKDRFDIKFLFHFGFLLSEWCKKNVSIGSFANVNMDSFRLFKLPIPPIEEQKRIADILDQFDELTNDIAQGLPREIELREKQYCYYRDLLLNFSEEE